MAAANGVTGLTTSWLASRLGIQPAQVDAMRRAGQLLGVRRADGQYVFPAWQFGRDGRPLPSLPGTIAAARARGISDDRLGELLSMRAGLTANVRLADALRDGREEDVLRALSGVR